MHRASTDSLSCTKGDFSSDEEQTLQTLGDLIPVGAPRFCRCGIEATIEKKINVCILEVESKKEERLTADGLLDFLEVRCLVKKCLKPRHDDGEGCTGLKP